MVQWVYSKVQYFEEYLAKWEDTLNADEIEKNEVEKYLKQLDNPFGFLDTMQHEATENDEEEQ